MKLDLRAIAFAVSTMCGLLAWACSESSSSPAAEDAGADDAGSGGTSSGEPSSSSGTSGNAPAALKARAEIRPTSDASTVQGTAEFIEQGSVTFVNIDITSSGGTPGEHGIHIHENGSCDPVDGGPGLGAGGHWNPEGVDHGHPSTQPHHVGDLGNIVIDDAGAGSVKLTFPSSKMYVREGPLSVVGHALVYHAERDDGVSQPVGNAGGRPGCGVIQKVEE